MILLRRFVSEPLVQFLAIGIAVFAAWSLLDRSPRETERQVIEVGPGRIAQLYEMFGRTWQRPPTLEELNGLIEAFVREEIFYREGTTMGLDRDDTLIRRRMQQKMEFLIEPSETELNATDTELQALLEENAATFHVPVRVAFRQVFFDPAKRDDAVGDAAATLGVLKGDESAAIPPDIGDTTLLPPAMPLMRTDQIATNFGGDFAKALAVAAVGRWSGPIVSTFGQHLVFVELRTDARNPELDEVRDVVLRDWQSAKRRAIAEERYRALRASYEVTVTLPGQEKTAATGASD